ncbi:MAG: hypothetical protein ACTHJ3_03775 [Pararhizobium sp.]
MINRLPPTGSVIRYPYLWRWQYDRGETEGRKDRPVCLLLAIARGAKTHLVLLAISATPPRADQRALAVPPLEKRRAGLRDWKEAWITVSEYNYDIAEESYYFDPDAEIGGQFSKAFLGKVAEAARPFIAVPGAQVERL